MYSKYDMKYRFMYSQWLDGKHCTAMRNYRLKAKFSTMTNFQ